MKKMKNSKKEKAENKRERNGVKEKFKTGI